MHTSGYSPSSLFATAWPSGGSSPSASNTAAATAAETAGTGTGLPVRSSPDPLQVKFSRAQQEETHQQLAQYLGLSAEDLDMRLPGLRWIATGESYAVHAENSDRNVLLHLGGERPIATIPAHWLESEADRSPRALAARKLHRLMIEYAPRRLKELLLDRAAPVAIGTARFHLPVENPGADRTRARLCDGSWLELERSGPNVVYVPVASAGTGAAQSAAPAIPADEADADSDIDWDALVDLDQHRPAAEEEPDADKAERRDAGLGQDRGKRRASRSPEGEEQPRQRVRLPINASGAQRWESLSAYRRVMLRRFENLTALERLQLNVAASSGMPRDTWEDLQRSITEPPRLLDAIRSCREAEFLRIAAPIAQVERVRTIKVSTLKKHLLALKNPAHQKLVMDLIIQDGKGELPPNEDDTQILNWSAAMRVHSDVSFLNALAEKAQGAGLSEAEWLKRNILNPEWDELPPDQRANPYSKQHRLARFKNAFGSTVHGMKKPGKIIQALTGVDLDADEARAVANEDSRMPNPFLGSSRGVGCRALFNDLVTCKNAIIDDNLRTFSSFFANRALLGAPDPESKPGSYANAVPAALKLISDLGVKDRHGQVRNPVLLQDWLRKELFEPALEREVQSWDGVGELSDADKKSIRNRIKLLTGDNANPFYPLIQYITGINLRG